MNLVERIATEFNIPIVDDEHSVWFFRTKAGEYYEDFRENKYIALGWDLLSPDVVLNKNGNRDTRRKIIEEIYPEEKRPGLILSQMEVFFQKMKPGDLIVIPSEGGKEISIGKAGELQSNAQPISVISGDYVKCEYTHRRTVEWIKTVDISHDIYLFKALRAQQTISELSDSGSLVFRNLFPVYVTDDGIHITIHKDTDNDLNLARNIDLQYNLLKIVDCISDLYGKSSYRDQVNVKTAVGSPGFIEIILPYVPISTIAVILIVKTAIGKEKDKDGTITGILAIISKINELINDHFNRKKTVAEAHLLDAEAEKTKAEAEKTRAEAALVMAQVDQFSHEKYKQVVLTESGKTDVEVLEEEEKLSLPNTQDCSQKAEEIIECSQKIQQSAAENGMSFAGERIEIEG